jgi:hypothetical protein
MRNKREGIEEMLALLGQAPDDQIDKKITKRLRNLIGKPIPEIKTEVMHVIDDCVFGSLSSGFALETLHLLHENLLDGKPEDWNDKNCPWRKSL